MNVMRRLSMGVFCCVLIFTSAAARAQALKQLPGDAMLVLKLNNPSAVSAKIADWCKRLGVDKMVPPLADPLAEVKRQLNIKEGFNDKGEIAAGLYEGAQPGEEPRVVVLIPVSDYKAFTGNLANTKVEGEMTSFTLPDDAERLYAINWGSFAAITPNKELLANKPTGVMVGGLTGKQLDANDITVWVNAKLLASKALPMLKGARPQIMQGLDQELQNAPGMNPKFVPLIKVAINQVLNGAEEILMDGQAATFSLNFGKEGINTALVAEFEPASIMSTPSRSNHSRAFEAAMSALF